MVKFRVQAPRFVQKYANATVILVIPSLVLVSDSPQAAVASLQHTLIAAALPKM